MSFIFIAGVNDNFHAQWVLILRGKVAFKHVNLLIYNGLFSKSFSAWDHFQSIFLQNWCHSNISSVDVDTASLNIFTCYNSKLFSPYISLQISDFFYCLLLPLSPDNLYNLKLISRQLSWFYCHFFSPSLLLVRCLFSLVYFETFVFFLKTDSFMLTSFNYIKRRLNCSSE